MLKHWKKRCNYLGCSTTDLDKDRKLHRFPYKDPERCSRWVQASGNPKLNDYSLVQLHTCCRLCDKHFRDWCYMNLKDKRLVHNAVPDAPKFSFTPLQKEKTESTKIAISESSVSMLNLSCISLTTESPDADNADKKSENKTLLLNSHGEKNSDLLVETNVNNIKQEIQTVNSIEEEIEIVNSIEEEIEIVNSTEEEFEIVDSTEEECEIDCVENIDDSLAKAPLLAPERVPENGIMQKTEEQQQSNETVSSDADSSSDSASYPSAHHQTRKRKWSVEQQLLIGQQKLQDTCDDLTRCMKRICVTLEETTAALKTLIRQSEECKYKTSQETIAKLKTQRDYSNYKNIIKTFRRK